MIQLTVSIAAYNVEKYISKALESCIISKDQQKYLEIIIVNDGSTDNTLNIASKYQKQYPDLFKIINKENGGYGSTVNAALKEARGRYFKLLDGDDWYDTSVLEQFIDELLKCNDDVIFTNYVEVNENNKIIRIVGYGAQKVKTSYRLNEQTNVTWAMHSMAVKTKLLINNNVKLTEHCFYTDTEYVFYIIKCMTTYRCFNLTLYRYLVGTNGQSMSRDGLIKHKTDIIKMLKTEGDIMNYCEDDIKKYIFRNILYHSAIIAINSCLLCAPNKQNKHDLIELDNQIKKIYPEVYELVNQKFIYRFMRKLNYRFYRVFRLNALRKYR